jgi:hypothetical protein
MAAAQSNPIPLGSSGAIEEQAFDLWRFTFLENLWRDVAYGARSLRRSPVLVVSALLSLALGIGANTAMFSLAVEFLFSEPSVSGAGSLVSVRLGGGNSHAKRQVVDFVRASGLFQDVAGENEESYVNWNDGAETHRIFGVYTTKNYFTALGIPVAHGGGILPGDSNEVVVLLHQFWLKRFNVDPTVVGRAIQLDGKAYTVVGILPATHRTLLGFGFSPDVYLPRPLPGRHDPGDVCADEARNAARRGSSGSHHCRRTVPSASLWRAPNGWKAGSSNCCPSNTSTSYSRCLSPWLR